MDIKSRLSEGVVIAGIPVIGYWFSFIYQVGYCKYFEIPAEFIDINIQNVFICSLGLAGMLGIAISIGNPLHSIYNDIPSAIRLRLRRQVTCILIYMALLYINKNKIQQEVITTALIFTPLVFIDFILPIITHKTKKTYLEKLEACDELDANRESLLDTFASKVGFSVFSAIFYTFLLSIFIGYIGAHEAANKTQFMTSKDQTKIVLTKYGEQFIVAKFNRADKTFTPEFSLEKIDSSFGVFTYKNIGPLTVRPDE